MNISSLKSFVVAAREHSFSHAADLLHLTQPGLSRRISVLEDELGTKLFDRIGRRVFLTLAGKKLVPYAEQIIMTADNAKVDLKSLDEDISGPLVVSTTQHLAIYYLQTLLHDYVHDFPQVDLSFQFSTSQQAHQGLIQGELEIAFITAPLVSDPSIHYENICDERMVYAASVDHPLSQLKTLSIDDLTQYVAILPGCSTYTRQRINDLFSSLHLSAKVTSPSNYLEVLRMLTAAGVGWSMLAEPMLDERLTRLALYDYEITRKLVVAYHKDRILSGPAQVLIERIRQPQKE